MATLDVPAMRRLWASVGALYHQPKTDHEALSTLHYARTISEQMSTRARVYSHRWLLDYNLPSGLPDDLKPAADRLYPRIAEAVGLSLNTRSELLKPILPLVQAEMNDAISEAFADGRKDTPHVRMRMAEAKTKAMKKLVGV